jgi:hypothetical protein
MSPLPLTSIDVPGERSSGPVTRQSHFDVVTGQLDLVGGMQVVAA